MFNLLFHIFWCILPSGGAIVGDSAVAWVISGWIKSFSVHLHALEEALGVASGIWVQVMGVGVEVRHGFSLDVVSGSDQRVGSVFSG